MPLAQEGLSFSAEIDLGEALPDVFHSLRRGVEHVFGIEAVVAEFIVDDLVGGEIGEWRVDSGEWTVCDYLIHCEQERGLGELGTMIAVFAVADGAYRKDYADIGVMLTQNVDGTLEIVGALVNREFLFGE